MLTGTRRLYGIEQARARNLLGVRTVVGHANVWLDEKVRWCLT
jgi:hypothetical protein